MREIIDGMKDITVVEPVVTIRSRLNEISRKALEDLANEICK